MPGPPHLLRQSHYREFRMAKQPQPVGENQANRHQKTPYALHSICNIVITKYNLGVSAWHHIPGEKGAAPLQMKQPKHL